MAELEAEHKARQQGATREKPEFAHLLDRMLSTSQLPQRIWASGSETRRQGYLDKNTHALAQALYEACAGRLERSDS